ncbi:MAG: cob(I)yrinic acid a,c-diamide adenosyltransferase [Bacteroidaceae bacterium]|nr:cob(I)yrinic acid a,c-diamide adenosyltransferase [Bacteroidaceae bacterium]
MKIYTKTGDGGTTSLVGGNRVSKTHVRLEAYGTVDELNAQLGVLLSYLTTAEDVEQVRWLQHKLFTLGTMLATEEDSPFWTSIPTIVAEDVQRLEQLIDAIQQELAPLHAFVLPGATRGEAVCHVCRTVCRRLERRVFALQESGIGVADELTGFLNRLSDYLFVLARKMNRMSGKDDFFWNKSCD